MAAVSFVCCLEQAFLVLFELLSAMVSLYWPSHALSRHNATLELCNPRTGKDDRDR